MIIPEIVTYASTEAEVTAAMAAGADRLLLEDSKLSLRSYHNDFGNESFEKLVALACAARQAKPDISLTFNCDILAHDRHFPLIRRLCAALITAGISSVRLQDPGLSYIFKEEIPDVSLQLATETGTMNYEGLRYFSSHFERILLNNDMPVPDIEIARREVKKELELQVHGPILIQYSNRRYMAGFGVSTGEREAPPETFPIIRALAQDREYEGRYFPFYDNPHGHFMYLYFDRCLAKYIGELMALGLDAWLVDGRGESPEYATEAIRFYKTHALAYGESPGEYRLDPVQFEQLERHARRPLKPGFFRANKTDQIRQKKFQPAPEALFVGTVLDVVKDKTVTIEAARAFPADMPLDIHTPTGKVIHIEAPVIYDLGGHPLSHCEEHRLIRLNWRKGIIPKSKVYLDSPKDFSSL